MQFECLELTDNEVTVIVQGDMDALGCKGIQPLIDDVITMKDQNTVVVDMAQVGFLDSSGIGAIVYLYKRLRERDREMALKNVQGQPLELMQLLRISNAIPVNPSH
ncbi:STAS domain-containing protein [Parasalinivibrio latis]|uniref:STAS domain-containing protein n=1 Tax=Parasalinivibrio latis TaxID=2952610 RepID=UPI0030E0760B